jgi:hypothetical protein
MFFVILISFKTHFQKIDDWRLGEGESDAFITKPVVARC